LRTFIADLRDDLRAILDARGSLPDSLVEDYETEFQNILPDFELVLAQLDQPAIDDHLRVVGLTGAGARLKTGLFSIAHSVLPTGIRATRLALKAANHILGSLLALPGVDRIKEFKESVEVGLDVAEYLAEDLPTREETRSDANEPESFDL